MGVCSRCGDSKEERGDDCTREHKGVWLCADCLIASMDDEIKRLRAVITDIARGDPFHEHPDDAELAPGDVVMDYAAYRFAAKKALEAKGA